MIWRNTPERYGAVHKVLHWGIALAVVGMLVMGLVMGDIANPADRFWVYSIHKATGITILALMVFRLLWKLYNRGMPGALPSHSRAERVAASVVHWGFYALLIAMPLSGWILTSAANSTINWFGLFAVPKIAAPDQELRALMSDAHEIIAWGIWAFLGLHVAGALKHAVIDRDGTLRRMMPFASMLVLAVAVPVAASAKDGPLAWTIDHARSTLTFEATQEGSPFDGAFSAFDGTITMDPAKPEAGSSAQITIDLGSVDSKNAERDEAVKAADWFDIATSATATYKIERFEKGATPGAYTAIGELFLRGVSRKLDLPFTIEIGKSKDKTDLLVAHAKGQTSLKRLDYELGAGQWADPAMIGNDVIVRIDITATASTRK